MSEVTLIRNPESPVVVIQPTTTTITAPDNMDAAETATQAALEANLARNDAQTSAAAADTDRIAAETAKTLAEAAATEANAAELAAEASADASAASAAAAATSASQAAASQSAAAASATTAAAQASAADAAKSQAATSASQALASKNAAEAAEAVVAASAADAASEAALAETYADAAEIAAGASLTNVSQSAIHRVDAETFADAAETSAIAAASSAASASADKAATAADRVATNADRLNSADSASAAGASANSASISATNAASSAAVALASKTAAETARDVSIAARTTAENAADTAEIANTNAQSASSAANSSKVAAETARSVAEGARDQAITSASQASTSASAAASSASAAATSASDADADRVDAQTAKVAAESARDSAQGSATAATAKASEASGSAAAAAGSAATAQASQIAAQASQIAAATSASAANTSAGLSSGAAASALAIYGSVTAQQAAVVAAQAQASLAAGYAASASSVAQQDLSGVTAQALHRSPNAITSMFIYDTSKDSDGGAWTEKCQHTSWYNEPLSGKWLGAYTTELSARLTGANTAGPELVSNGSFSTGDLTGWTNVSNGTGTASVEGGRLKLTKTSAVNAGRASQTVATVSGKTYLLSFEYTGPGGYSILTGNIGSGVHRFLVRASSTSVTITLENSGGDYVGTGFFANVSFKEFSSFSTAYNDYFQLTTDGKFYRLWKNLITYSEQFTNAAWTKVGVVASGSRITANAGTSAAYAEYAFANAPAGALTVSYVFPPSSGRNRYVWIGDRGVIPIASATFDLNAASVVGKDASVTANAVTLADGSVRCSVTYTRTSVGTSSPQFALAGSAYTSDRPSIAWAGGEFLEAKGQLEYGSTATTYEPKAAEGSTSEVFRGNKADFPRLAAIVAETNNLTIYDLTEPGRPMWMRFVANGYSYCPNPVASIHALNGLMGFAGSATSNAYINGGFRVVDFMKDRALKYHNLAGANEGLSYFPVSGRNQNSAAGWISQALIIAGDVVSSVAMAVLPDAPVDPVTGLRVPTIAVATEGGLSFIRHDGTVATITDSFYGRYIEVVFERRGSIVARHASSAPFFTRLTRYFRVPQSNLAIAAGAVGANGYSIDVSLMRMLNSGGSYKLLPNLLRAEGNVSLYREDVANGVRSLVATLSPTFNTGWMAGDIRRCFLSDTEVGSATGPELVTNGGFAIDTSWTKGTGVTIAGGVAQFPAGTESSIQQAIPLVAGKTYRVSFTVSGATASGARVRFGGQTASGLVAFSGNGTFTTLITAPSGATTIDILSVASTFNGAVDNVSVREAVLDRSYKAASALVDGTLTRAALATGTSLVGYSGFSAANYLREPYSADLDFGTGEWSCSAWVNIPSALGLNNLTSGPELVTNGDFSNGSTAWTLTAGATVANNQLEVNVGTYTDFAQQSIVVDEGWYVFSYSFSTSGSGNPTAWLNSTYVSGTGGVFYLSGATNIRFRSEQNNVVRIYDNVSLRRVYPAAVFSRSFSSGPRVGLFVTPAGTLRATAFDGTTTRTVTTTASYNTATWLKAEACYTTDGTLSIRVNGREVATSRGNPLLSLNSKYNLLSRSDLTTWTTSAVTLPDAETITPTTASAEHYAIHPVNALGATAPILFTAKAKPNGYSWVRLFVYDPTGGNHRADFNLSGAGTVGSTSAVGTCTITGPDASGYYSLSMPVTSGAGEMQAVRVYVLNGDNSTTFAGDGTSGVKVKELQIVRGTSAMPFQQVNSATDFDFKALLTIGNNYAADAPFPGSIALLKLGATVPTYEQSQFMYEQEKQLFRTGAQSVLPDSGSIVDMAYDDATDRWVAVSATNESYWTGLVRNSVTPVPAGSYTRVVAGSGLELVARSTTNPGVDVTIPAYGLREELVKRAEAAARLTKELVTYDYVGGFTANTTTGSTAITNVSTITYPGSYVGARISGSGIPANTTIVAVSGTTIYLSAAATATATGVSISFLDFELPVGMEARTVFNAGIQQREGATAAFTRLYDGFIETIRFGVAPGATALVSIQAQRTTIQ